MAQNQTGIAIVIRAFIPMGKSLDDQLTALTLVKDAHETGDYSKVLAAATIDDVKAEQKTRRGKDNDAASAPENDPDFAEPSPATDDDEDVPAFVKKGKSAK